MKNWEYLSNGKYIKQMRLVISHQKMILRLRNSIY